MENWSWTNFFIVLATLMGPIIAIQAQKILERRNETKARRICIFRTLMMTRAAMLSNEHVGAFNSIPIEFHGKGKEKEIVDKWKLYLKHLEVPYNEQTAVAWSTEANRLFFDMLHEISKLLGYGFSRVEIEGDIYSPRGHASIETDQQIIRVGLAKMFAGEFALPIEITNIQRDGQENR
ncbi:MAG: hypothetical protein JNK42_02725 [Caedimonas sp.]|nr:hypothetical protein [Caedimonas sp.]